MGARLAPGKSARCFQGHDPRNPLGEQMKLSSCQVNAIVTILENTAHLSAKGSRGIVIDRYPDDRVSGGTTVHFESGSQHLFVWDSEDPSVKVEGTGRLTIQNDNLDKLEWIRQAVVDALTKESKRIDFPITIETLPYKGGLELLAFDIIHNYRFRRSLSLREVMEKKMNLENTGGDQAREEYAMRTLMYIKDEVRLRNESL